MLEGDYFLLDEISLADDAVLERINSVLEPSRTLLLAEKGGAEGSQDIVGSEYFRILATMNPGGDFGKKELSPALRNRFTEVWIPSVEDSEDLKRIVADVFADSPSLASFSTHIVAFLEWCKEAIEFRYYDLVSPGPLRMGRLHESRRSKGRLIAMGCIRPRSCFGNFRWSWTRDWH